MGELIPPAALAALPPANAAVITGKAFFPDLLSIPFMSGIGIAFGFSAALFLAAAAASWLAGGRQPHAAS
ncbi:hypothetical protein [Labrys wisconsinensis]|uniref:Uncharacterized protein n=1 Tax=Labrys wisconsinensis TaxID=425677 RepID=A0ABU0JGF8_9HYPH|nr:hypothetical protein [Labrys wisconsinensis]MDQ0473376.1 hypothetical protein [Labrys wisconsinensis]